MDMRRMRRFYEVRWARRDEWAPAMEMVWRTFLKYEGEEYSEEGVHHFFEFISGDELHEAFLQGEYLLMVALDGERIIGAGTVRDRNHLSLLFVDEAYHRRGVGSSILRKRCAYLEKESGERYMSLEASPYAVSFYQKQGFRAVRPDISPGGIRATPMDPVF